MLIKGRKKAHDMVFQFFIKLIFTGVFLSIIIFCSSQLYKIWLDKTIVLVDFSYTKDGIAVPEIGKQFTKLLAHDLRLINETFYPTGTKAAAIPSTDLMGRGEEVALPQLSEELLSNVEIQAYGLQLNNLLKSLNRWVQNPYEIQGDVSEREAVFSIYANFRNNDSKNWLINESKTISEASKVLASRVFHELLKKDSIYTTISDESFYQFSRALVLYEKYRSRLVNFGEEDSTSIAAAKVIIETNLKTSKFAFVHKLAAYVYKETNDYPNAISSGTYYLSILGERKDSDKEMTAFIASMEGQNKLQQNSQFLKDKVIRPGSEVGDNSALGTISCIVEKDHKKFILTADFVVNGEIGSPVYLPDTDTTKSEIGKIVEKVDGMALVELNKGLNASNEIILSHNTSKVLKEVKALSTLAAGMTITTYGRNGILSSTVKSIASRIAIFGASNSEVPSIMSQDRISSPGDSGAPVLADDGALVGFVYAASEKSTIIIPAEDLLKKLNVVLVTKVSNN